MKKTVRIIGFLVLCSALAGCFNMFRGDPKVVEVRRSQVAPRVAMRWDHRPEAARWTQVTMNALSTHGAALPAMVPRDIDVWCPGYRTASNYERRLFWTGLISTLAKWESTWRPEAVGGGNRWFGLTQISPRTARGYECRARTGNALKNGSANLSCAVRIAAVTIPRDGVIARNGRGFADDWAPFNITNMRNDMANWTRRQAYCN